MTTEPQYNRRATDTPEFTERVIRLEVGIGNVRDTVEALATDLRSHVADESSDIGSLTVAMERLSTNQEVQTRTLERVATTLETVAVHTARVQALEDWRAGVDPKVEDVKDRVDFAYKLVAIAVPLVVGLWTVGTYFKWW